MSSNPIKLFAFAGVAAALAGGLLSNSFEPGPSSSGVAFSQPEQKSWLSGMFEGMEFQRRGDSGQRAATQDSDPNDRPASKETPISSFGAVILNADNGGHYHADIEVEGQRVSMLVDTGATLVALRYEDASRLGIDAGPNDFVIPISTANGEIKAARARLREVRLENITVTDVQAVVLPAGVLERSLLGMSFLKKLSSFQIAGNRLVLKP